MTGLRRVVAAFTLTLTWLVALTGCGVPQENAPRSVPAGQVDSQLLAEASPTGTPSPTGRSAYQVAFVIGGDRLKLIPRPVASAPAVQQVQQLLATLAAGPDDAEHAKGLSTALPPEAKLSLTALDHREALVAIDGVTKEADPRRLPLSVAQVVLTLTSHPAVHAVRITFDGQPVEAPLPGGYIVHGALTASDYASFLAPPGTPAPTRSP